MEQRPRFLPHLGSLSVRCPSSAEQYVLLALAGRQKNFCHSSHNRRNLLVHPNLVTRLTLSALGAEPLKSDE